LKLREERMFQRRCAWETGGTRGRIKKKKCVGTPTPPSLLKREKRGLVVASKLSKDLSLGMKA